MDLNDIFRSRLSRPPSPPLPTTEGTEEPTPLRQPESPLFEPDVGSQEMDLSVQMDLDSTPTQDVSVMNTQAMVEDDASRKRKAETEVEEESDCEADYDGEEMVPAFAPEDRPLPNLPIYHPDIKLVQANSMEMVQKFQERIRGFTYKDGETRYLLDLFNRLEHPPHETTVTKIALHGDAGHGKSSFLNALLGVDISDWGDDGNSCTFVVQEFAQASPTQTQSYKAEIQFFSRNACIDMIKDLFQDCYSYLNADEGEEDEGLEALQMAYNTAMGAFSALFKGKREFRNREAGEEFLRNARSADDQAVLGRLVGWTEDILGQLTQDGGQGTAASTKDSTIFNADTVQGLKKAVRPFTTTVEFAKLEGINVECCPWPLVKKVRTTFRSKLLEQNITIADCPGTSDKNGLRVDLTKEYLADCDITIVVSKIDRAIDNAALYHNIAEAYRRKRSGSVIVVCTRSDDVNMNGEQRFASTISEERVLAKIAEDEIRVLERLERARNAYNLLPLNTRYIDRFFARARKEKYERQKQEMQRRRFEARVMARNRHVKESIQQAYKEDTKDPVSLPVFCVSNTMFMTYMSGYEKKDCPSLSLEGTQILAARDHIIGIPSTGKFNQLSHHVNTALELAIDTVEISCSTTKMKRKEDLNRTFERARGALKGIVENIAERFVEHEFGIVLGVITANESKWINRAGYRCDKWSNINPASHRAIMRKGGAHGTPKVPWQDWNEEIYKILREDLDPAFEAFYNEDCEVLSTNIAERIGDTIDSLDRTLDNDPAAALSGAVKAFKRNLRQRRKQIDNLCEQFKDTLRKDVRTIQMKASTHAQGHYLSDALSKAYQFALDQPKGRGQTLHKTRCTAFKGRLCAYGGLFALVHDGVRSEFEACFNFDIGTLVEEMDAIFNAIQHDVDRVCSTNEDDSDEAKAIRAELLAMLPAEREFLKEKIQGPLMGCKGG